MRSFLCLTCGEVYDEFVENEKYIQGNSCGALLYVCPKMNCGGTVVEIDDFLISVIRNLNNYGFNTMACCSGHSQDSCSQLGNDVNTYIMFERVIMGYFIPTEILNEIKETLPKGYDLDSDSYGNIERFTITKNVNCKSESDCIRIIGNNCAELLEWTENQLPILMEKLFPEGLDELPLWVDSESEFIGEAYAEDSDFSG